MQTVFDNFQTFDFQRALAQNATYGCLGLLMSQYGCLDISLYVLDQSTL